MILHSTTKVHEHAARIAFTLSCLQEGIRRTRARRKAQQYDANLATVWRG